MLSLQLEADAAAAAITGSLKTASGEIAMYVDLALSHRRHLIYTPLFLSVAGARVHLALAPVPVLVHGVVRLHPVADVRGVLARAVALLAAAHATVIASNRKHSHALSVGQ